MTITNAISFWDSSGERGQHYLQHEKRNRSIALFIRSTKKQPNGRTMPYFCAGTASYVEHQSERPIQITWRLQYPLPGDVFVDYRAAVV